MSDRMKELRDEAKALNEPFSPALHARMMAAVRAEASPVVEQRTGWRYGLAVAAVVAIAAGAWVLMRPAVVEPPKPIARDFTLDNPLRGVLPPLGEQVASSSAYAYLDQDAAALGRYVMRQLNAMPEVER
jgi:hypothetical protein